MQLNLIAQVVGVLAHEEGFDPKPYYCSEGYPTIGYGFKLGPKNTPLELYQFEVSQPVAKLWLEELIRKIMADMLRNPTIAAAWNNCTAPRKAVLVSMAYQMGVDGLASFSNALEATRVGNWTVAESELLDSKWHKQTPARAKRHAHQFLTGSWNSLYLAA